MNVLLGRLIQIEARTLDDDDTDASFFLFTLWRKKGKVIIFFECPYLAFQKNKDIHDDDDE